MEAAPLSLAHIHARNAVLETRKANPIAASEEHDLAAGEFANAAKGTRDTEALRVLHLLEKHHVRLSEILKTKPEGSQSRGSVHVAEPARDVVAEAQGASSTVSAPLAATQRGQGAGSTHSHPRRDASSSIASNLATARGIAPGRRRPGTQSLAQLSHHTAEGRVVPPQRRSRFGEVDIKAYGEVEKDVVSAQQSSSHTAAPASTAMTPPPPIATAASEEPFSRFYSTFHNLINTLSAPLAFAGLPLNPTDSPTQAAVDPSSKASNQLSPPRHSAAASAATADPDLKRLFSRAALRAAREENGFGPVAESFYVVPTTGGTMSYAGMLSNARGASNVTDEDPDAEFVDAPEMPAANSPQQSRYGRHRRAGSAQGLVARRQAPAGSTKTWEELNVENETLKSVVLDLGDRLRAFELGAQKSSLALHASMRQFSSPTASVVPGGKVPPLPGSAASPLAGLGAATKQLEERIRELEEEVKAVKKDNRKLGRENQKYLAVIEKYRERWEALKEGAKERLSRGGTDARPAFDPSSRENSKEDEEVMLE